MDARYWQIVQKHFQEAGKRIRCSTRNIDLGLLKQHIPLWLWMSTQVE